MDIQKNLTILQERITDAAHAAGRDPATVRLVAVTKTFPPDSAIAAYAAGVRNLGENRVEEAGEKIPLVTSALPADAGLRWHLIGHLQRRKARLAVELFDLIQSVDSVPLARTLDRHASARGERIRVLLQVNVARDPNKFGFQPEPLDAFIESVQSILALPFVEVRGLMTIGALVSNPEQARTFFRGLRELRDMLSLRFPDSEWFELSMGMTDDFAVAIAEGATIVRIGRAIFGERSG